MDADARNAIVEVLERSRTLGFLGPGPIEDHLRHAVTFEDALVEVGALPGGRSNGRCLDLGTGGGVPGLVLAARWPSSHWTLLDSMERRTAVLRDEIAALGQDERIEVICARAESAARQPELRQTFDVVTARSFGPPAVTAECARGFLVAGGHLVVSDPPDGPGDRWPIDGLTQLALSVVAHVFGCTVLRAEGPVPEAIPRGVGRPGKRPAF